MSLIRSDSGPNQKIKVSPAFPVSIDQAQLSSTASQLGVVNLQSSASKISPKWPQCAKTYNSKWEKNPLLKTWIARHPNDNGKVVCRFCQSLIRAHKNDLLEHTRTLKHQRNFMQYSSPEEYNQFVMELQNLRASRKESIAKSVDPKNQTSTTPPPDDVKPTMNLTPVTPANSSNFTTPTVINRNAVLNLSSNIVLEDELDNADFWQEQDGDEFNFVKAQSPSDLLSVIIEEQHPTSTSPSITSGSFPNSNNISLTSNNAIDLSSNAIQTETLNDTDRQPSVTLQSYVMGNYDRLSFTSNDVVKAILDGRFTFGELCAIAKAATTQIEYSFLIASNILDTNSQNITTTGDCTTPVNVIVHNMATPSTPPMPATTPLLIADTRVTQSQNSTINTKIVSGRSSRKRKVAATK